jgi:hypothetical protein
MGFSSREAHSSPRRAARREIDTRGALGSTMGLNMGVWRPKVNHLVE